MKLKNLQNIEVGDVVERMLDGSVPMMDLEVSEVSDTEIICGAWKFSRRNGAEIDEDLGWDEHQTGSFIRPHQSLGK